MDNRSQRSKRALPNTPRVNAKIIEYYQKFGQDRDLEKFMRLYSSSSSQDSEKTPYDDCVLALDSCCKRIKGRETKMPQRSLRFSGGTSSKSLPNIDVQGQSLSEKAHSSAKNVIADLNVEAEGDEKIFSKSTENLKTPQKVCKNSKPQTPESVAKSHKRLEWDSLGDVGYKKSMSTSNISTLERSLLRNFLKDKSVVSEPGTSAPAKENRSITRHKTLHKIKAANNEHSTPPLACSTLIIKTNIGTKPKMISQYTSSTSLNEKFEKYAQTSIIKPSSVRSQEIQCNMSSSNSIIEGTATPSSFEYYSSKSSKSSDLFPNTNTQFRQLEHPFITSIRDLLKKRKALVEKNQQKHHQLNNMCELQTKFQTASDENKENESLSTTDSATVTSISLSKRAPELDLGIQLICSLVEANSINAKQKRQLIRDIISRLTRSEGGGLTTNSSTVNSGGGTITNSNDSHHLHVYDSVHSNINNRNEKQILTKSRAVSELGVSPITMEQVNTQEKSLTSSTNTSGSINGSLASKQPKNNEKSKFLNLPESHQFQQQPDKKFLDEDSENNNKTKVSSAAAAVINKETQSEIIKIHRKKDKGKQTATNHKFKPEDKYSNKSKEQKINRCTQTSKTSATSSSETSTPELTTEKCIVDTNNEINNSNTDGEQPSMREWLNPLTQSEFEYEEKKQLEMKKKLAAQQQKLMKKSKHDCGRTQQLNWIENEIKRLECLKHLLLKDETSSKSSESLSSQDTSSVHKDISKNSTHADKLYDTVYSDKSSVLTTSAEQLVQEIEIILEESHEDFVNLKDNIKRTKDRKRETQIVFEKKEDPLKKNKSERKPQPKPKLRIINENINFYEEQVLNDSKAEDNSKPRQQREKIDTPSTDKSQESESLKDLVQQRKREFIEAYKSKKQHHYEALKQQQKEDFKDFKYLNTQRPSREKITTSTDSVHYSVPHTLTRNYVANDPSYYTQHPLPLTPLEREARLNTQDHLRENISASTTSSSRQQSSTSTASANSNNTTTTTTTSSSSRFCVSSDVSVPMGSQNSSSTLTTTHQYDDVAAAAAVAGVAVQTSDSILRSKPIYGPQPSFPLVVPYSTTTSNTTACIQVKPKGIAYVIEFNDNKHHHGISNTDLNSNDKRTNSNTNSLHSNTSTTATNNLRPSEPILTLQDHLEIRKPNFLKHSKERRAILKQLQSMRQERSRQLREIISNTSINSLDKRLKHLPPPPIQKVRILKTKEMKALTSKRFAKLPEVVAKKEREIEEKKRRSNRILTEVFNRRLQKRVRSGLLSLNHSKTVI